MDAQTRFYTDALSELSFKINNLSEYTNTFSEFTLVVAYSGQIPHHFENSHNITFRVTFKIPFAKLRTKR
jgi:hypothetical protein